MFDVVTVPDFISNPALFELRSLLFLGSWHRNAGSPTGHPLHLACIGEPPASVLELAEKCGARVSVFEPVDAETRGGANKLRGLEIDSLTGNILLLDTDIFVFQPLEALDSVDSDLAACPADIRRLPDHYWRQIFAEMGLNLPTERMESVLGQVMDAETQDSLPASGRRKHFQMIPYFNSGVVFTRDPRRLRSLWEENIRRIGSLFDPADSHRRWLHASDQAGLAAAFHQMQVTGASFELLPWGANTRWLHAATGAVTWEQALLYHATGLFRPFPGSTRQQLIGELRAYTTARIKEPPRTSRRFSGLIRANTAASHTFAEKFAGEVESLVEEYIVAVNSDGAEVPQGR